MTKRNQVVKQRPGGQSAAQASGVLAGDILSLIRKESAAALSRASSPAIGPAAPERRDRPFLSVWEIDASLEAALTQHDPAADLWLFGYNALMWNPIVDYDKAQTGLLKGWHREFCIRTIGGRAVATDPGLILALEPGGESDGRLFRIPAERVRNELRLLWQWEMSSGIFGAEWVQVETDEGPLRALTFVADPTHLAYIGKLEDAEIVACLLKSRRMPGGCADYLKQMTVALSHLGLSDPALERLSRRLKRTRDKAQRRR